MGCRPQWDAATGRVTGIEVLPPASLGRPRVDVTWRISGLFRDMFPTQIALIDAAANAVATRDEDASENPLAARTRTEGKISPRIFGTSPGTYGAGVEDLLASGNWTAREEIGRAYLDATRMPMAAPTAKRSPRRAPSRPASPRPTFSSTLATTPAATFWKAPPMSPSSAAFRQRLRPSAGTPTSSCSTPRTRRNRSHARLEKPYPASCAPAPSIRALSPARCDTARAAPRNSPRPSTASSALPKPPRPFQAR
ncbi:hypothetical protein AJ88_17530 [Mesorhizobium amorphae CCBAU 01583]|nr:hypothetical protein AJ88_17530 [Mesorhizobium amorphae CCBAU 01583]